MDIPSFLETPTVKHLRQFYNFGRTIFLYYSTSSLTCRIRLMLDIMPSPSSLYDDRVLPAPEGHRLHPRFDSFFDQKEESRSQHHAT